MRSIFGIATLLFLTTAPALAVDSSDMPWLYERKIQGAFNLVNIAELAGTEAYEHGRPIARVEAREDGFGFCTGSRVGPNLFLTNYHCDHECETMQFDMG